MFATTLNPSHLMNRLRMPSRASRSSTESAIPLTEQPSQGMASQSGLAARQPQRGALDLTESIEMGAMPSGSGHPPAPARPSADEIQAATTQPFAEAGNPDLEAQPQPAQPSAPASAGGRMAKNCGAILMGLLPLTIVAGLIVYLGITTKTVPKEHGAQRLPS